MQETRPRPVTVIILGSELFASLLPRKRGDEGHHGNPSSIFNRPHRDTFLADSFPSWGEKESQQRRGGGEGKGKEGALTHLRFCRPLREGLQRLIQVAGRYVRHPCRVVAGTKKKRGNGRFEGLPLPPVGDSSRRLPLPPMRESPVHTSLSTYANDVASSIQSPPSFSSSLSRLDFENSRSLWVFDAWQKPIHISGA